MENLDNPAPSNPVVLEDPNLPSVIQCSNPRDARVSQTRDQTDDMSDFLLSLVTFHFIYHDEPSLGQNGAYFG